jgi:hypothetical protein
MQSNHYTAQERAQWVKKFKESNLDKHDFCKLNGISYASLYRWLKNNTDKKIINNFTPITMHQNIANNTTMPRIKATSNADGANVKIKLPNGVEIEIPETYNIDKIVKCIDFLLPDNCKIWLNNNPTDMRKGVNGLSVIVVENFTGSLQTGDLFIFHNKNRDKVKLLYYHFNGFCLLQKILDKGVFKIPKTITQHIELNMHQLNRLFEGLHFINKNNHDIFY